LVNKVDQIMKLTLEELRMASGEDGPAVRKAMEILVALGTIYHADRLVPVSSVQVSGVSYDNLGEAGLEFLLEMAGNGGKARVFTTLNPAGMDVENWQVLGIDPDFARNQQRVIDTYSKMGILPTCSCTPYLFGNLPHFGEHVAWAESSAICYANSVLGARTNREGGPSALAASLTGRTPNYGLHLVKNRRPTLTVHVKAALAGTRDFGALGIVLGRIVEGRRRKNVPYLFGIPSASGDQLKSLCASLATYGGLALFHLKGITPESDRYPVPAEVITINRSDLDEAIRSLDESGASEEVDFASLGCPHLSLPELARVAELLKGRKVKKEFWITTSRPVKQMADQAGYTSAIQEAGALIAADTCCVVAPIRGRFKVLATDSAKACYYAASKNGFKTRFMLFDEVVQEALK
jgi:predicted aconitase